MKKFYLASVFALAGFGLASAPTLLAQASNDQITMPAPEYNAYQAAITPTDPKQKASASESFLTTYPDSKVKREVLDGLVDAYFSFDQAKTIDAATRLLQIDPNNLKSLYLIALIKKQQAGQVAQSNPAQQAQLLDDAAAMATKGLAAPKPDAVKDEDFKKQKAVTDPFFHSVLAYDAAFSKKDYKTAITEFRTELEGLAPDATKSGAGLNDTYQLADAYTKIDPKDMINAVWFFSRAADYAPANFKAGIEGNAKYWYKRYHGKDDGFDTVEAAAANSLFPPDGFTIAPAPTAADIANKAFTDNSADLASLALGDKEYILANASKENAEKLWAIMKDQTSQVPGLVIASTPEQIQVAVTDDAKQDKKADFTVNMKTPLKEADVPAVGSTVTNLIGTYDSYTQSPAQIILRDGELQAKTPAKKPAARKPAAGHRPAAQ